MAISRPMARASFRPRSVGFRTGDMALLRARTLQASPRWHRRRAMPFPRSPLPLLPRAAGGPCARLLSNGELTSLVSAEGSGFVQLGWRRVSAFAPDAVEPGDGLLFYLRDEEDGAVWSLGSAPAGGTPERYAAHAEPGLVRIEHLQRGIEACCEITLCADAKAELRRVE